MKQLILYTALFLILGSCGLYEENMAYPLGIRLSNPGNIKRTHIEWKGMTRFQNDPKYIRFENPFYGVRVIVKILTSYNKVHGLCTINGLINRYSPTIENFTHAYIRDVSERTGFFPNEVLDMSNENTLVALTKAMVIHESGMAPIGFPEAWYEDSVYYEAVEAVLKGE